MTALFKDRDTKRRAGVDFVVPVAGGKRIFTGAVVCLDSNGFGVPAAESPDLKFPCVAIEQVDNRDGLDGEISVNVIREVVGLDAAGDITRAHIGRPVYLADDHTVTAESTGRSRAGLLVDIQDGQAWVDLTA